MKQIIGIACAVFLFACNGGSQEAGGSKDSTVKKDASGTSDARSATTLDTAKYDQLMNYLANGDTSGRWPVKGTPYPLPGAILPFNRVVAYYGNLYSNRMGALGKWPKKEMIPKLLQEVKEWNEVDTVIKSIPCLHYIAMTAQGAPGKDGMWRYRMPLTQIDTILNWAKEINAIVFIDIQIGLSSLQKEVPYYEKYLSLPNVHLGIDPEFAMAGKGGKRPGSVIGTMDAADINWVGNYLADLVKKNNLPPKMFMIHRFTKGMVTNYKDIKLHPELQVIMDMDGWGPPDLKKGTYRYWVNEQPVQFTGFKLFYVNDTEKSGQKEMMGKKDVISLRPRPIYIQYQ
ncbi:MAG: lipoprotein [Flaviaesturariibacter sp.]|nr:lipoprotein [Flaviaesturariibacter sp.]